MDNCWLNNIRIKKSRTNKNKQKIQLLLLLLRFLIQSICNGSLWQMDKCWADLIIGIGNNEWKHIAARKKIKKREKDSRLRKYRNVLFLMLFLLLLLIFWTMKNYWGQLKEAGREAGNEEKQYTAAEHTKPKHKRKEKAAAGSVSSNGQIWFFLNGKEREQLRKGERERQWIDTHSHAQQGEEIIMIGQWNKSSSSSSSNNNKK